MRPALALLALALSGCATTPPESPWTVSNPQDRHGWTSRMMCYGGAVCRPRNGVMKIGLRVAF